MVTEGSSGVWVVQQGCVRSTIHASSPPRNLSRIHQPPPTLPHHCYIKISSFYQRNSPECGLFKFILPLKNQGRQVGGNKVAYLAPSLMHQRS